MGIFSCEGNFFNCSSIEDELDILIRQILKENWRNVVILLPNKHYFNFVTNYFRSKYFRFKDEKEMGKSYDLVPILKINDKLDFYPEFQVNCFLFYQTILDKDLFLSKLSESNVNFFITFSNLDEQDYKAILDKCYCINSRTSFLSDIIDFAIGNQDTQATNELSKHLVNREIREKFIDTFNVADEEIDIISPWISDVVVDEQLINLMESCFERGVKIKILYGIGDDTDTRNQKSEEIAEQLKCRFQKYNNIFKIKKTNIHYKLLLCDLQYGISGSYNFLSFRGDYDGLDNRLEGADLILDIYEIKDRRARYFSF